MIRPHPSSPLFPYTTLFRSSSYRALVVGTPTTADIPELQLYLVMPMENEESTMALMRGLLSAAGDRKSTRLNSSHVAISYAVFCLKKKTTKMPQQQRHNIRR